MCFVCMTADEDVFFFNVSFVGAGDAMTSPCRKDMTQYPDWYEPAGIPCSRSPDIDREPTRFLRIKTQHTYRLCSLATLK